MKENDNSNEASVEIGRRDLVEKLVKTGAGALAVAMSGGVIAAVGSALSAQSRAEDKRKHRFGMVVDTRRCVGCKACMVACKSENKTPPGVSYNKVLDDPDPKSDVEKPSFMTKPCFHCENPPCIPVCPVGATFKRASDGLVVIDYDRCVGAQDCIKACPYEARSLDTGKDYPAVAEKTPYAKVPSPEYNQFRTREGDRSTSGKARKCTFCMHLQDDDGAYDKSEGRWPSCAKTCTGHAIHFGDFNDQDSEVSKLLKTGKVMRLKENLGTQPNVYYLV